jgi:hypothetical protein
MNPYAPQNPYAAPQAPVMPAGYAPGFSPARVEGNVLVIANGSQFPAVCLKCGTTHAISWRDQKFRYVPRWALLFAFWIQMLVAKNSRFYLPLCQACNGQWKKWNIIAGVSWLPGAGLWLLGGILSAAGADDASGVVFLLGTVVLLVGLITALILRGKKIILPTKIDKTHSWLRGVHPTALQAVTAPPPAYPQQPMFAQGYYPPQGQPGQPYPPS